MCVGEVRGIKNFLLYFLYSVWNYFLITNTSIMIIPNTIYTAVDVQFSKMNYCAYIHGAVVTCFLILF